MNSCYSPSTIHMFLFATSSVLKCTGDPERLAEGSTSTMLSSYELFISFGMRSSSAVICMVHRYALLTAGTFMRTLARTK